MTQQYLEYDDYGQIVCATTDNTLTLPAGYGYLAVTDAQAWLATNMPGWTVVNGALTLPDGMTNASVLSTMQAIWIAKISAACKSAIIAGFTSSALGAAYTYPAKPTDQQNLTASIAASLIPSNPSTWTTPFWCADSSGNWAFRNHTAAQIQQVGDDAKTAIMNCIAKNQTLAVTIETATTIDAVYAISW